MIAPGKTLWETMKLEETVIQKSQAKLRVATINVRTLVGRSAKVKKTVGRSVDIITMQEVLTARIRSG